MDRLEAMSLFVAAAEAGSLSAAGRRFAIPLATVSRKVSDLERHLKTRLLNRSTRQLTLTDAGHAYLAACRRILDEVGEAERTAAGRSGTLRTVLEAFEPQPWPVSLVHAGQGLLPVKLRAFLDFAAPRLKKRLVQATWQA
ncbi:LysR family transcriptional regulator [Mesorhizobium sp. M1312]|uniref:LysR family transcriptional regulator n=1 Tax=unclassified Mesorhizobium TaxID=325217 RepID=UPI00333AA291